MLRPCNDVVFSAACAQALSFRPHLPGTNGASAKSIAADCRSAKYSQALVDVHMTLKNGSSDIWWEAKMFQPRWMGTPKLEPITITAFVSKVFPSALDSVMSGGIIGVYVVVVLAIGRMIRGMIAGSLPDIAYDEVPNIDYVLALCLDIFLVREAAEFLLEIELFAKLLFLFRSPATLIEVTRPKQE